MPEHAWPDATGGSGGGGTVSDIGVRVRASSPMTFVAPLPPSLGQILGDAGSGFPYDVIDYDTDGMFTAPSRITFNRAGKYKVWFQAVAQNDTPDTATHIINCVLNNTTTIISQRMIYAHSASISALYSLEMYFEREFSAGDFIDIRYLGSPTGAPSTILINGGTEASPVFGARKVV